MEEQPTISKIINLAERIGTIGSPSSTKELSLDILGSAVEKKLVGELAFFKFRQDGMENYALGQITDVQLKNTWLEDPTMRSLARQRGQVNPISGQQDTHLGIMTLSAVFANNPSGFEPSILGTVPQTGTNIQLANDELLNTLLSLYQKDIFYLGNVYGSKPKLPLWFKHFDSGIGGAGEAYHIGIFGKTGSGKSTLAKEILLAYAKHKKMGIFILDPQGEFSKGLRSKKEEVDFDTIFGKITLKTLARKYYIIDLNRLALNRWDLFCQLLIEFKFFFELGIKHPDYQSIAADYVERFLREASQINFNNLLDKISKNETVLDKTLGLIYNNIHRIYSGEAGRDNVKAFIEEYRNLQNKGENRLFQIWRQVSELFIPSKTKRTPKEIVNGILKAQEDERFILTIDLNIAPPKISRYIWDEKIKPLIIDCFLDELILWAELSYKEDKSLNTLVVIDEAHRLAPRGSIDNPKKEKIRNTLIDAVRTTRKYGLGWMFVSQNLATLDKTILDQLRISFFGFGLSLGAEFQALKEIAGGDQNALKLYQSFRDPQSALDIRSRQYSFMTIGPVSPLSFAGTPLFFTAFNNIKTFLEANKL